MKRVLLFAYFLFFIQILFGPYFKKCLELHAHIFTQAKSCAELVLSLGFVEFEGGPTEFGSKQCVFSTFFARTVSQGLLRLRASYLHRMMVYQCRSAFGVGIDLSLPCSIFGSKKCVLAQFSQPLYLYVCKNQNLHLLLVNGLRIPFFQKKKIQNFFLRIFKCQNFQRFSIFFFSSNQGSKF